MKAKVTVEFPEGVKYTREVSLTTEYIALLMSKEKKEPSNKTYIFQDPIFKALAEEIGTAAQGATKDILTVLQEHGRLFTYNERIRTVESSDSLYERKVYEISDINEFLKFKKSLEQ